MVNLIRANELQKAMNLILNARLKSSPKFSFDKNRHNLYRDLLFLTNMALGPGNLCMGKLLFGSPVMFETFYFHIEIECLTVIFSLNCLP